MKNALSAVLVGAVAVAMATATADTKDYHTIMSPGEIEWAPGPDSIPPGAQVAVLYGDPGQDGLFALRVKLPASYHVPPHTHPKPEIITVISGTFYLGMGEEADRGQAQPLEAGSFFAFAPGMSHYVYTDEETVIQLNSSGPWGLEYVNADDDPRTK